MFVWLTFSQTLTAVIAGCEAAWGFFGGVFKVLIPDNLMPVVAQRRSGEPEVHRRLAGLRPGPRVRHRPGAGRPTRKDKPRVERMVQYVRDNFFAGEDVHRPGRCPGTAPRRGARETAGLRIHGTTCARPAEVFAEPRPPLLLPAPAGAL